MMIHLLKLICVLGIVPTFAATLSEKKEDFEPIFCPYRYERIVDEQHPIIIETPNDLFHLKDHILRFKGQGGIVLIIMPCTFPFDMVIEENSTATFINMSSACHLSNKIIGKMRSVVPKITEEEDQRKLFLMSPIGSLYLDQVKVSGLQLTVHPSYTLHPQLFKILDQEISCESYVLSKMDPIMMQQSGVSGAAVKIERIEEAPPLSFMGQQPIKPQGLSGSDATSSETLSDPDTKTQPQENHPPTEFDPIVMQRCHGRWLEKLNSSNPFVYTESIHTLSKEGLPAMNRYFDEIKSINFLKDEIFLKRIDTDHGSKEEAQVQAIRANLKRYCLALLCTFGEMKTVVSSTGGEETEGVCHAAAAMAGGGSSSLASAEKVPVEGAAAVLMPAQRIKSFVKKENPPLRPMEEIVRDIEAIFNEKGFSIPKTVQELDQRDEDGVDLEKNGVTFKEVCAWIETLRDPEREEKEHRHNEFKEQFQTIYEQMEIELDEDILSNLKLTDEDEIVCNVRHTQRYSELMKQEFELKQQYRNEFGKEFL